MWEWRQDEAAQAGRGAMSWGFTDRLGGVSRGHYEGLNLGGHVGDDPADVEANRVALASDLGLAADGLVFMEQVHGADVALVDAVPAVAPRADAMVTRAVGIALVVLVADCVPVLLADREAGVVAVAHAGRAGLVAGVVPAVVSAMRDLGAQRIRAVVGPSVCAGCYEVPAEMMEAAATAVSASRGRSWSGTPAIDVAAGVLAQLASSAVAVERRPACTRETRQLFSHRRSGVTGRFAGVVLQGRAT